MPSGNLVLDDGAATHLSSVTSRMRRMEWADFMRFPNLSHKELDRNRKPSVCPTASKYSNLHFDKDKMYFLRNKWRNTTKKAHSIYENFFYKLPSLIGRHIKWRLRPLISSTVVRLFLPQTVYDPFLTCFNTREYGNALQTSGLVRCSQLTHAYCIRQVRGHGCVKILEIEIASTHVESELHLSLRQMKPK